MKKIIYLLLLLPFSVSAAETVSIEADFDSLGGNQIILERAQALAPEKDVSVVQNRTVPRTNRLEIAPEFSGTFGGDAYNQTKSLGINAHYHINPRWSLGAKYDYSFNTLTPEGRIMSDQAVKDFNQNPDSPSAAYPLVDYPKSQMLALVNWYPFYGKMNMMDKGVAQFDVYFIGGYGQVQLSSGAAPTYTGGAGVGFWVSKHISTRAEMRYQNYKAKTFSQEKNMDLTVASLQMGWML